MIKNLTRIASLAVAVVFTATAGAADRQLWSAPTWFTNSSIVFVDPNGNDSTAIRGVRDRPFKNIYNCDNTNTHKFYGAIPAAKPGDTVVVLPGVHFAPAVPLNGSGLGVNLHVVAGATLIRTNRYWSISGVIQNQMVGDGSVSPFIVPGNNSHIIVDGEVVATNATGDAILGWWETRNTLTPFYGYTNRAATNIVFSGTGTLVNTLDGIYINQRNPAASSLYVSGLHFVGLYDNVYIHGNCNFTTVGINSLVGAAQNHSRGVALESGVVWTDYGSFFGCGGAATTYPLYLSLDTDARFYGTRIYVQTPNSLLTNSVGSLSTYFYYYNDPSTHADGDLFYTDENGRADHVFLGQ